MLLTRSTVFASLALALMLQGCAATSGARMDPGVNSSPGAASTQTGAGAEVPELNLHLPKNEQCNCSTPPVEDYTFLEKGYKELLDGEYEAAMEQFQRYQRLDSSPRAALETGIAMAYVRMLPRTSFYDPVAARNAFRLLEDQKPKKLKVHEYTRLMRQALLNLLELQKRIDALKAGNSMLKEDLQKREEALKRLRDLTLKQNGAAP